MKREVCAYCDRAAFMRVGKVGPLEPPGELRCLRHLTGPGELASPARLEARAAKRRRQSRSRA